MMSTPGYLSNSELSAQLSSFINRWNLRENQMIALISQPDGTVFVTDGLGNDHELSSFPQLQKDVQALLTQLGTGIENVDVIIAGVQTHATAAQTAASNAAASASDAATSAANAADAVAQATQDAIADATAAKEAAQAAHTASAASAAAANAAKNVAVSSKDAADAWASNALTSANDAASAATSASTSATAAASARTGAESARDAAQGYAEQAQAVVDNAGGVVSVAGKSGAVTLDADDIVSGVFTAVRIPKLAISKINGLQAALDSTLPDSYIPAWDGIADKPDAFPPQVHTHLITEVTHAGR